MSFRLGGVAVCLLLAVKIVDAAPCARLKSRPDAWVDAKVDALVTAARAAYERDEALAAYERVLDGIAGTIRRCGLAEEESFIGRHREFVEYVEAASLDRQPDHELGFNVPDRQYFDETRRYVQIPDFLLTPGFVRAVSRFETLERAKSYLRQLNTGREPDAQLIFFSYTSRHLGTPDNDDSFRRLLVVVPGNAATGVPEKWVQFGVSDPGQRIRTRNVSVVSALVGADGTFNAYFKDFYRTYRRDGSIPIEGRWELGYGDDNCAQCHKSGVLPIFPVAGSVGKDERQAVERVNERFRAYGSPRFDRYLDLNKFGPGLSAASAMNRHQRFGDDFGATTVARAMTCAACHEPARLGPLNWPMDGTLISSYVKGGQMPFGFNLKPPERAQLYNKLIGEYFSIDPANPGILKSWLSGRLK